LLQSWSWMLRYLGLAALFAVVYFLVLRPLKKQALAAFRELPGKVAKSLAPAPGAAGALNPEEAGVAQPQAQRAKDLKKLLTDKVKAEPAAASRLVESWVREDSDR
jgi:flagellar biosynthesis/type III secretory pathway M-ring protein FliF/YscJ